MASGALRDGVGRSCVALPDGPQATLGEFLCQRFAHVSAATWAQRFAAGEVSDEAGRPLRADAPLRRGARVFYYRSVADEPQPAETETLLYQDEHLLAVDKPHFMPVTPGGATLQQCLLVRCRQRFGLPQLAPLHRIDRETAGVVLFSVQPATRGRYQALFREQRMDKVYEAWVHAADASRLAALPVDAAGRLQDGAHFMQMEVAEEGPPNAFTRIELLRREGAFALLRLLPRSGKRHQLRVQCAALGLPIVGDLIYPALQPAGRDDPARPLQLLARRLAFDCPLSGRPLAFVSQRQLLPISSL